MTFGIKKVKKVLALKVKSKLQNNPKLPIYLT